MTEMQELTHEEERALLKDRNRKAREAINTLVAENQALKDENAKLREGVRNAGVDA